MLLFNCHKMLSHNMTIHKQPQYNKPNKKWIIIVSCCIFEEKNGGSCDSYTITGVEMAK